MRLIDPIITYSSGHDRKAFFWHTYTLGVIQLRVSDCIFRAEMCSESPCNHTGVVSESCFKAIFHHELMNTCNIQSLERLIAQFDRPIFISMAPIPSQDVLKQNDFPKWLSNPKKFLAWCYQMQKRYLTERFIATGKARWLFDEETGADEWHFTDKKYAAKTDAWHMEQRYGDFVLSKISDKLVQL